MTALITKGIPKGDPQVTFPENPIKVGVSVGNGHTKAATDTDFISLRSLVSPVSDSDFFQGNSETLKVVSGNNIYRIGTQKEENADRVADSKKTSLYPLLAVAAIAKLLGPGAHTVALRCSVLTKAMGEALALEGTHTVTVNDHLSHIKIVSCKFSPEGMGAIAHYRRLRPHYSKVFALDLGHGTTLSLKVVDGRMDKHGKASYGVADLHSAIAEAMQAANGLEYRPSNTAIDAAIRTQSFVVPTTQGDIEFTDIYNEQLGLWWRQIQEKCINAYAEDRQGCAVLLMGGGSMLPNLAAHTKAPLIGCPAEAETRGLAAFA